MGDRLKDNNPGTRQIAVPPPPMFSVLQNSDNKMGKNGIISLVDIFDEFLFAPPNSSVAPPSVNIRGNETSKSSKDSKVQRAESGKITKDVDISDGNKDISDFRDDDDCDYDSFDGDDGDGDGFLDDNTEDGKKRKRTRGLQRNMTEVQKVERRFFFSARMFDPIYYK